MPDPTPVQLGRVALTKTHLRALEITLYRMADLIDRLMMDGGVPYTKMPAPQGALPAPPPVQPIAPARDWTTTAPTLPGANMNGGQ